MKATAYQGAPCAPLPLVGRGWGSREAARHCDYLPIPHPDPLVQGETEKAHRMERP